ncbi:MAG: MBL fold metallo-hydrolase [Spirochaetes bacterium]|nr:MBL fold metallo-hydrolase [Spirochaetota bacterium]
MKITTLIENTVYKTGLIAEHGFSVYLEAGDKKILFDTGQSDNFIKNASQLGIDLPAVDYCVISHGHYDHTGGLYEFCKINDKAKILMKKEALFGKYKLDNSYIGIPFSSYIFDNRIEFTNNGYGITEEIIIISKINIYNDLDTHFKNMMIKKDDNFIPDEFEDEQFLLIKKEDRLIIISGCSHRGITNIIKTAIDQFDLPVELVIGGFHLKGEDDEKVIKIIDEMNNFNIKEIAVSHCTGVEKYVLLNKYFKGKSFYNFTGNTIDI